MSAETDAPVHVCSLAELEERGVRVVSAGGRSVAVFWADGAAYAVDNRCPHMGFPMSRGTVRDGILTCHWHHARFELSGGCTFDPFADDLPVFKVEVRDGEVFLEPRRERGEAPAAHWQRKLRLVERALRDFGLMEAFEERPLEERAACLLWIAASTDSDEEEDRVSRMLDALAGGGPLVPRQAALRRPRARA